MQERRILGISAIFDWEAAGYKWDVRLYVDVEGRPITEVAERLASLPSVRWVMLVFGIADIVVHAQLSDRDASVDFLTREVAATDGVRRVAVDVNLEVLKYAINFARVPVPRSALEFPAPVVELDELDYSIIEAVVADGRQSNREIARQLGTSDGTVRIRLRRLEEAGLMRISGQTDPYVTGEVAAWAYVGIDVYGTSLREVGAALVAMPEILILTVSSGRHDLVALVVASHRSVLIDVILGDIRAIEGVRATDTSEIIRTVKLDYQWARLL